MNPIIYKILKILPDKVYLKLQYKYTTGKKLNLKEPKTYGEKLQWLKLYDRKPYYTTLVDKYEVREYIKNKIGEKYLVPILGYWDNAENIDFEKLSQKFVLKCNHDSKSVIVCHDKDSLNIKDTINHFKKKLKNNAFYYGREWPYKNIKPLVIAEEMLVDETGNDLKDYKVMCFNGEPKLIQIHKDRFNEDEEYTIDYYDINWNKTNITANTTCSKEKIDKPEFLEEMLYLSKKLSQDLPQARIDWYYANNQLYFGEITFFDASGYDVFDPSEWNYRLGSWIDLSIIKKENYLSQSMNENRG